MKNKISKKMVIALIIVIIAVGTLSYGVASFLPIIGDVNTPANAYVSKYYILNSVPHTHAANIVTAVLADYRGFDTLFETSVLFLSGLTTMMVLSTKEKISKKNKVDLIPDDGSFGSLVMDSAFRLAVPIVLIYGIYVLIHGEISLGGGFQAGALLAVAYLLDRIIPSFTSLIGDISEELALIIAGVGVFIYAFTGILPMFNGGNFLEYGKLPFAAEAVADLHSTGILMIEIGVTIAVMGVIIAILEIVLERTEI